MDPEQFGRWREHVGQMTDEQIEAKLAEENWVGTAPAAGSSWSQAIGATGGYRFDPNQLDEIIRECEELHESLGQDRQYYERLASVRPVAPDEHASLPLSSAVREFGDRQIHRNSEWRRFLADFTEKLRQSRQEYGRQDEQARHDLGKATGEQP